MKELTTIVKESQRVLTTQQLAELYEADAKNISNNFNRNNERFVFGKHYFRLEGEELKEFKGIHQNDESLKYVSTLYLWTEKGCLHHAKMLNTDIAWNVYEQLEDTYFRVKENTPVPKLSKEIQAIFMLDEKQQKLESEIKEVKTDLTDFKDNSPLFNTECKELQSLVKSTGVHVLGGKSSQAYKDNSLRQRVYQDIQRQIKREFGVVRYESIKRCQFEKAKWLVDGYALPIVLEEEVIALNNQMQF